MITIFAIIFVIALFVVCKSLSKTNNEAIKENEKYVKNLKLEDESNRQIFNMLVSRLTNYDVLTYEEDENIRLNIFPNILNEHDKDIIGSIWLQLRFRDMEVTEKESPIKLNANEKLYEFSNSISLYRIKTTSHTIVGNGFRTTTKGFRAFVGSVRSYANEEMTLIEGIGKLYVTNQRLIYITPEKQSYVVPMKQILEFVIDENAIILTVAGKEPYKFETNNNLWYDSENQLLIDSTYELARAISFVKNS